MPRHYWDGKEYITEFKWTTNPIGEGVIAVPSDDYENTEEEIVNQETILQYYNTLGIGSRSTLILSLIHI